MLSLSLSGMFGFLILQLKAIVALDLTELKICVLNFRSEI